MEGSVMTYEFGQHVDLSASKYSGVFRARVGTLEGKPLYVGDVIYDIASGLNVTVVNAQQAIALNDLGNVCYIAWEKHGCWTWEKPAPPKPEIMFKIRSRKTGKYSKGGVWPTFSATGKVWKRKGDISSHFSQLDAHGRQVYHDMDVEVVELHVVEVETTSGSAWIDAAKQRAADREAAKAERVRMYREDLERKQLAALIKKYGAPK